VAFLYNIPQATDQVSISQGNLLNNFSILGAIAGNTNASSASLNATSGFNWVYLASQSSSIPPVGSSFPSGSVGIYSATNPNTSLNELYVNKPLSASVKQVPMTAYTLGGTNNGNGWTYLPSGLLMAWGRSTTGGSSSVTLTYATELINFPGFNSIYAFPQLTRLTGSVPTTNFVVLTAYTQTTFTVGASSGSSTGIQFAWFVIGI
jgi:hypothetical protein